MAGKVVLIRHGEDIADDRVQRYFAASGLEIVTLRPYQGQALPAVDGALRAAVVFGGPFCVNQPEVHPFLADENRFIEACLRADLPFLGICQGAQQLATVLGAYAGPPSAVAPGHGREFGYYALQPRPQGQALVPAGLVVPQAHFHTFAIPDGARHLASSERYPNQAFSYGSAYGFQFHAEVTKPGFRRWQTQLGPQHYGQPGVQTKAEQDALMAAHDAAIDAWFMAFMDRHFGATLSPKQEAQA